MKQVPLAEGEVREEATEPVETDVLSEDLFVAMSAFADLSRVTGLLSSIFAVSVIFRMESGAVSTVAFCGTLSKDGLTDVRFSGATGGGDTTIGKPEDTAVGVTFFVAEVRDAILRVSSLGAGDVGFGERFIDRNVGF